MTRQITKEKVKLKFHEQNTTNKNDILKLSDKEEFQEYQIYHNNLNTGNYDE